MLFAVSGAANCGIDIDCVYGVFRAKISSSCEDIIQEEGLSGQRPDASALTESYMVCLSLESLLILLNQIYIGTVHTTSYRKNLLINVEIMLACLIVPTYCLKLMLAHKSSTPFI